MSGVRLRRVAVVTRDRPQLALRCLESYAAAAREFDREIELAAYDDSPAAATRATLREGLGAMAARYGVSARYAGPEEKGRFIDELDGALRPAARFALGMAEDWGAPPIGANRNAVALDAAGDAVFMTDDDSLCLVADVPGRRAGARCADGVAGFEHWFFPDRAATLAACPPKPADLLGLHEAALGRPAAELLPGAGWDGGRAVVTLNGYLGDGASSSRSYLHLTGGSRERLRRSEESFWLAVRRREECRGVTQTTLSRGAYFMGAFAGLDLRRPLPPFPPAGRGEDGAFGALRWALQPEDFSVVLPVAALHDPRPARAYSDNELRSPDLSVCDVVFAAALAAGPVTAQALGADLERSAADASRFQGWLGSLIAARYRRRVEDLRALRGEEGAPPFWRAQVERALEHWSAALSARAFDVSDVRDRDAARLFVGGFGALLGRWAELAEAARRGARAGRTLSVAVA